MAADHPVDNVARTLTLVAKTLQNLANLVQFGAKEPYMKDMNNFITANQASMKRYIDDISSFRNDATSRDFPIDITTTDMTTTRHTATVVGHLASNFEALEAQKKANPSPACDKLVKALNTFRTYTGTDHYESIYSYSKAENMWAVAIFDYQASHSDEVSLVRGLKVQVTSLTAADAGWWEVLHNGRPGLIPSTHARLLDAGVDGEVKAPKYVNVEHLSITNSEHAIQSPMTSQPPPTWATAPATTEPTVDHEPFYDIPDPNNEPPTTAPQPAVPSGFSASATIERPPPVDPAVTARQSSTPNFPVSVPALAPPASRPSELVGVKGYVHTVSSKQAESLLDNTSEGTYLIRPRKTEVAAYAIAVRGVGAGHTTLGTKHFKLILDAEGNYHLSGRAHVTHPTIKSFVAYYKRVPLWDEGARLETPFEEAFSVEDLSDSKTKGSTPKTVRPQSSGPLNVNLVRSSGTMGRRRAPNSRPAIPTLPTSRRPASRDPSVDYAEIGGD